MMLQIGKGLIYLGIGIVIVGIIVWGLTRLGLPIGRLPGDVHVKGEKTSVYFPIVTCIVISIILTILLNVFYWLFRR